MFKKIIISLILILALISGWHFLKLREISRIIPLISPSPIPTISNFKKVSFSDEEYGYQLFKADQKKLKLIVNRSKETAENLVKRNKCQQAVNAGFYDTQNKPLGLIISNGRILSEKIVSLLLDGFLIIEPNKITISRSLPESEILTGFQSGPMLLIDDQPLVLSIIDDKAARIMIALKTKADELIFLTVFDSKYLYYGPKLADLPAVLKIIANEEKFDINDALNLDGGTASYFKSTDLTLSEYNPIGSLICLDYSSK